MLWREDGKNVHVTPHEHESHDIHDYDSVDGPPWVWSHRSGNIRDEPYREFEEGDESHLRGEVEEFPWLLPVGEKSEDHGREEEVGVTPGYLTQATAT